MIIGILAGLMAALLQSVSYLFSRRYVTREGHSGRELFALSHVWMGLMAVAMLPFLWSPAAPPPGTYIGPAVSTCLFYLIGQIGLFYALRWTDASRVSPMLGLKIVMLACITASCFHSPRLRALLLLQHVSALQWVAVAASVVAALELSQRGGRIAAASMACIVITCLGYSLSDLSIGVLVERLRGLGGLRGSMYGCCVSYVMVGAAGVAAMPRDGWAARDKWRLAFPVALVWLGSMFFLYLTFKQIGVLFGNVVQATRGLMSIGLGALLAHWQYHHLESGIPRDVFWRRVAAASLMALAIACYFVSKRWAV